MKKTQLTKANAGRSNLNSTHKVWSTIHHIHKGSSIKVIVKLKIPYELTTSKMFKQCSVIYHSCTYVMTTVPLVASKYSTLNYLQCVTVDDHSKNCVTGFLFFFFYHNILFATVLQDTPSCSLQFFIVSFSLKPDFILGCFVPGSRGNRICSTHTSSLLPMQHAMFEEAEVNGPSD